MCFLVITLFGIFSFAGNAFALTLVNTDIEADMTWSPSGSPYILERTITVLDSATLSIEPGVEVKFKNTNNSIYIFGKILALGTEALPIVFTSNSDDTYSNTDDDEYCFFEEYDDEGNGVGSEVCEYYDFTDPYRGDWGDIYFIDSTDSVLDYVNIRYGRNALTLQNSKAILKNINIYENTNGLVMFTDSSAELENAFFDSLDADPITLFNDSFLSIKNVSIKNIDTSLITIFNNSSLFGEGLVIEENIFGRAREYITLFNSSSLVLKNSTFTGCPSNACITFFDGSEYLANPSILNIENSVFDGGSGSAFLTFADSAINAQIHNSVIQNFLRYGIESYASNFTIDAVKNFWGDPSGPYDEILNPSGLGAKIYGKAEFSPWCKTPECIFRNPVIFIPGVMGNDMIQNTDDGPLKLWLNITKMITDIGDEFMDPLQFDADLTPSVDGLEIGEVLSNPAGLLDYTEGLIKELKSQGYTEGVDLFTFSYDWRHGVNADNVNKLKEKISNVLSETGNDKVDIVAHSTGGLLTKKYVMDNPEEHNIDKTVFVGVPSAGAPQAIKMLLQGANIGIPFLNPNEMKKIARNLPVVYDLSPSEEYFKVKGSYIQTKEVRTFKKAIKKDLNFDEANTLLLDRDANASALNNSHVLHSVDFDHFDMRTTGVDVYNIAGCKAPTVGKVIEERYFDGGLIKYGEPVRVKGDGTVPLESATFLPVNVENKYFSLIADHSKMPSQDGTRQLITNILSGSILPTGEDITQDIDKCKLKGRAIAVYSPVSIEVFDNTGNRLGLFEDGVSVENNIPNASFEISDGHKFLYLPDEEGVVYTIKIKGTGEGTFTITDKTIDDELETSMRVYKDIPVSTALSGELVLGGDTSLILDNDGDSVVDQTLMPNFVLIDEDVQSFDPYFKEEPVKEKDPTPVQAGGFSFVFPSIVPLINIPQVLGASIVLADTEKVITVEDHALDKSTNTIHKKKISKVKDGTVAQVLAKDEEILEKENPIPETKDKIPKNVNFIYILIIGIVVILLAKKFIKL